jgi:hypothetical protein
MTAENQRRNAIPICQGPNSPVYKCNKHIAGTSYMHLGTDEAGITNTMNIKIFREF